jgi:hypothetical protein
MAGGVTSLRAAQAKGDVVMCKEPNGPELYYFLTVVMRESEILEARQSVDRTKATDDKSFLAIQSLVLIMGWTLQDDTSPSIETQLAQHQLPPEVAQQLSKVQGDLAKATRAAEKQLDHSLALPTQTPFSRSCATQCQQTIEAAEAISGNLRWILEFKVHKNGDALTLPSLQQLQHEAAAAVLQLSEQWKALRAMRLEPRPAA